ncbi:MAG: hypothetical protein MJ067_04060 [Oscillospiraceae bacterium]|nr:hypothetical protein [Oscillospiraceae bacterium]
MDKFRSSLTRVLTALNRARAFCIVLSAIGLAVSHSAFSFFPFNEAFFAIGLCGMPIVIESALVFDGKNEITVNSLKALVIIISLFVCTPFISGLVCISFRVFGLIESALLGRVRRDADSLASLNPAYVRIEDEMGQRFITAEELKPGDKIKVLSGEIVPADGVLLSEAAGISTGLILGSSEATMLKEGGFVRSGSINEAGAFYLEASAKCSDSTLQRFIEATLSEKAKTQRALSLADRYSKLIILVAFAAAAIACISGNNNSLSICLITAIGCGTVIPALVSAIFAMLGREIPPFKLTHRLFYRIPGESKATV